MGENPSIFSSDRHESCSQYVITDIHGKDLITTEFVKCKLYIDKSTIFTRISYARLHRGISLKSNCVYRLKGFKPKPSWEDDVKWDSLISQNSLGLSHKTLKQIMVSIVLATCSNTLFWKRHFIFWFKFHWDWLSPVSNKKALIRVMVVDGLCIDTLLFRPPVSFNENKGF